MTFFTHAIVGAAVGLVVSDLTGVEAVVAVPLNVGLSLLPDINLFWRKISDHHNDVTHYPSFWVIMATLIWYVESETRLYSISVLLSGLIHLILDTFGMTIGVHWLAPFHLKEFSFTKIHSQPEQKSIKSKISQFHRTRHLYYEVIIILTCTLMFWVL